MTIYSQTATSGSLSHDVNQARHAYADLNFDDSYPVRLKPDQEAPAAVRSPATAQELHVQLAHFNMRRLAPGTIGEHWQQELQADIQLQLLEGRYVEQERARIHTWARQAPTTPEAFIAWFEQLRDAGPGQHDRLFPWLAEHAELHQMRWFLRQEAAGEAGFDDLVAMAQVKVPTARAKLEMARNYWDEMGRGHERGMHGPMLAAVVHELDLQPAPETTVWESLALANLMAALAANRRYAYQAIGALGAIEMTAPTRVCFVNAGLKRLNVTSSARKYFQLHASLDIEHSKAWNQEVLYSLVEDNPATACALAEGALMRLACGAHCFERYRQHFGLR